jgi:hypothetical protein
MTIKALFNVRPRINPIGAISMAPSAISWLTRRPPSRSFSASLSGRR